MDFQIMPLAVVGLFLAGVVKGATGLGYASCALPVLVMALGLQSAMVIVVAPAIATCLSVTLSGGHFRETVRRFYPLYLAMLPGIAVGLLLMSMVQRSSALGVLGATLIVYAVLTLVRPTYSLRHNLQDLLQLPTGFLNGVITGLTGSQVMPLLPYVLALNLEPARSVQVINIAVMLSSVVLGTGLALTGVMTPELLVASLAAIAPALIGVEAGIALRRWLPVQWFRYVVLVILGVMGAALLVRA